MNISRRSILVFLVVVFAIPLLIGGISAAEVIPNDANIVADIAEEVGPSVVYIDTVRYATIRRSPFSPFFDDPFFRRFFDLPEEEMERQIPRRGVGSGFIFREDGYILTNHHVVAGAEEITVTLLDGREFTGRVIGADPMTDLAVVQVDAEGLPTVTLGDSDAARVGEWVVAIGNPYGLAHTVTVGVLSAKGRPITAGDTGREYENFLQTDAAINPGNSGGPLLNIHGEVIGINTAIIPFAQGLGFAIPINLAEELLDDLIELGRVIRAWLGVYIQDLTPEIALQFGREETKGALVAEIQVDSPAEHAGLQRGDIILRVEDEAIEDVRDLQQVIRSHRPGDVVTIEVWRDNELITLEAELQELEQELDIPTFEPMVDMGMEITQITPEKVEQFDLRVTQGLVITDVGAGSPADEAGLRPGDVVLEINRQEVLTVEDWLAVTAALTPGDTALLLIVRGDRSYYVPVQVEERE